MFGSPTPASPSPTWSVRESAYLTDWQHDTPKSVEPIRRHSICYDLDEVLAQVLALLQRGQCVSYRALKRRFDLDDDYLEDLKDEILKAKRLAMDEEGHEPPPQVAYPPGPRPLEAERRQLTVMFCDLVDSTKLSCQLDPEDYREVVRAYQKVCSEVIQRCDGHVAQLLMPESARPGSEA